MLSHSNSINVKNNDVRNIAKEFYKIQHSLIRENNFDILIDIVNFTKNAIGSNSVDQKAGQKEVRIFQRDYRNKKPLCEYDFRMFLTNAPLFAEGLTREFPVHQFSPHFHLFLKTSERLFGEANTYADNTCYSEDEFDEMPDGFSTKEEEENELAEKQAKFLEVQGEFTVIMEQFWDIIKTEAKSAEFETALKNYQSSLTMDNQSLIAYINKLSAQNPALYVYEFVLSHGDRYFESEESLAVDYLMLETDREDFFAYMERNLPPSLVGYLWKKGYDRNGFYCRVLFLFDRPECPSNLAEITEETWEDIGILGVRCHHLNKYVNQNARHKTNVDITNSRDTMLCVDLKQAVANMLMPDHYLKLFSFYENISCCGFRDVSRPPSDESKEWLMLEAYFNEHESLPSIPPSYS